MPRQNSRTPTHPDITQRREIIREVRQDFAAAGAIPAVYVPLSDAVNLQVLDASGNPVERHAFMLGVDTDGDPSTFLADSSPATFFWYRVT